MNDPGTGMRECREETWWIYECHWRICVYRLAVRESGFRQQSFCRWTV